MLKSPYQLNPDSFANRVINRNGRMGADACQIMAAAINAVNPYQCVNDSVNYTGKTVKIGDEVLELSQFDRVIVLGFGKASVPMAKALIDILGEKISIARVITKSSQFLIDDGYQNKLNVYLGDHPVPSQKSIDATRLMLTGLTDLRESDLVFVVVSGGGSALFTDPYEGISLEALQELTTLLLRSGAGIHEINILRKHLDRVKGGRLAARLLPATICSLILSDVVGDPLDLIASGPTVPDTSTYQDALAILAKYHLETRIPDSINDVLQAGRDGKIDETVKPVALKGQRIINQLVGTNLKAASAAKERAETLGYHTRIVSTELRGLTEGVALSIEEEIHKVIAQTQPFNQPYCLIYGGETTVRVVGDGKGGRNQDLVLRMTPKIADLPGLLFISLATDGEDGPTDAAGAATDAHVFREGAGMLGLSIDTYIDTNNSYGYLNEVGGLIKIGSTGTNVNDLVIILIENAIHH